MDDYSRPTFHEYAPTAPPPGDYLRPPWLSARPPHSLLGVTLLLWLALGVEAFLAVLSIAAYGLRLHVIKLIETAAPLSRQTVVSSNDFVRRIALLSTPMLLIVFVVLLVWVYEARKNLEAFRAGPFAHSRGMAVGSFFIPFVSLWWPYLVVQEIWKGSDPGLPPFRPESFAARRGSPLVAVWWVAFLANTVFAGVVNEILVATRGDSGLSHLRLDAQLLIASRVLRIVSVVLTTALAHRVLRRQDALARQMAPAPGTFAPPAPGTFAPLPAPTPMPAAGHEVVVKDLGMPQ
jgi:hypothetical protein